MPVRCTMYNISTPNVAHTPGQVRELEVVLKTGVLPSNNHMDVAHPPLREMMLCSMP